MSGDDHDDVIERMCREAVEMAARIAALESEVERLRGLLAEALPELDEHDAEYKYVTKSGLKERMREACAQSGEGGCGVSEHEWTRTESRWDCARCGLYGGHGAAPALAGFIECTGRLDAFQEVINRGPCWLEAYYYQFEPTGNVEVDRVLAAVAAAGKGVHSTEGWYEFPSESTSYIATIQEFANRAAARIAALEAEVERLRSANNAAARFMTDEPARLAERLREMEREVERLTQVNAQMLEALNKSLVALRRAKYANLGNETYWKVIDTVPDVERAIAAASAQSGEQSAPYCGLRGCTTKPGDHCTVEHCPRNPRNAQSGEGER